MTCSYSACFLLVEGEEWFSRRPVSRRISTGDFLFADAAYKREAEELSCPNTVESEKLFIGLATAVTHTGRW